MEKQWFAVATPEKGKSRKEKKKKNVLIAVLLVTALDSKSYKIERSPRWLKIRLHVYWEDEIH